jgi:hypothetical protein
MPVHAKGQAGHDFDFVQRQVQMRVLVQEKNVINTPVGIAPRIDFKTVNTIARGCSKTGKHNIVDCFSSRTSGTLKTALLEQEQ